MTCGDGLFDPIKDAYLLIQSIHPNMQHGKGQLAF
jgi:hypothetical protein